MDPITIGTTAGIVGFFVGGFIGVLTNFSRRKELKTSFSLYELTDMMAAKMSAEEDTKVKSDRADRIRSATREVVRKEFEV